VEDVGSNRTCSDVDTDVKGVISSGNGCIFTDVAMRTRNLGL
jgi:hypothetical protein